LVKEDAVTQKLANAQEVFVPSIALGELYFGAGKSTRAKENTTRIDEFASSSTVLFCDTATAKQYGVIKSQLKISGTPIPENDIWIAATATQYQLILVTRDRHFLTVEGLQAEPW
jgi:tRNA(fMet)-specific endonuclease VapC